jgi:predicted DCC family thiol-disulfide oxidoreductase YuxK
MPLTFFKAHPEVPTDLSTVVYLEDGNAYMKSTAFLRMAWWFHFPMNLLYGWIACPLALRDLGYDIVASNRYKWFGKVSD